MTGKSMEDGQDRTTSPDATIDEPCGPHNVELDVRRRLMSDPRLHFPSLVVHRLRDGVCLEGVVETDADMDDVERTVTTVCGVETILNRLVHHRPSPTTPPAKG